MKPAFVDHLILPLSMQDFLGVVAIPFNFVFSMMCNLVASQLVNELTIHSLLAKNQKEMTIEMLMCLFLF